MVRPRQCFLHIGVPKTGTSFLQRVLFENRALLESYGVRYPEVSLRGNGHHDFAFLLSGGYPAWATPQNRPLEQLEGELAEACTEYEGSVLMSSEDFYSHTDPIDVKALLERTGMLTGREPRIIVYLRRQDDAQESWYNQTIKALGYTHSLDESIRTFHSLWDYREQLERWADAFGSEAIVARTYEPQSYAGGSLLSDFFGILGVPLDKFVVTKERVNTGINADLLEFQRVLNRFPVSVQKKRAFHHQLIDLSAKMAGKGVFNESLVMEVSRRKAILADHAAGNAEVAETYFGRAMLFDETMPFEEPSAVAPGLTIEKLASILAWLVLEKT